MSAETRAALEAAIQAHITDECGDARALTDWVVCAGFVNLDSPADRSRHSYIHASEGPAHSVMGLVNMLSIWKEDEFLQD